MPRKISFQAVYSSSADEQYPANELHHHGPFVHGWQSSRACSYPQELVLQFESFTRLKRVQLLSHQFLIASKIEFLIGDCSSDEDFSYENAKYKRLGYIELSNNERSDFQARELKSIHVDADGLFLKLVIHKNFPNRHNLHNQVGIVALNLLGDIIDKSLDDQESQYDMGTTRTDQISIVDDLAFAMYQDPEIAAIIKNLDKKKQNCVNDEQYEQARKFKQAIYELAKIGERLARYEVEKRQAIENEDYEKAQFKKDKMELYRTETYKQLRSLNLLDIVIEGGEGTEFLKRLRENEKKFQQHDNTINSNSDNNDDDNDDDDNNNRTPEPIRPMKQVDSKNHNNSYGNRRSPESRTSYANQNSSQENFSTSPLPVLSDRTQRSSITVSGTDSVLPEIPKPRTPYEDKVIPTLRNRNRADAGQLPNPTVSNHHETARKNNDDSEIISGLTISAADDDVTAELNQAEMIEANQMMIVFDKQLISKLYHRNHTQREEALDEIYQILKQFSGDQEDARAYLRAGSFVVARMFRFDVLAIFTHSLQIYQLLMNDYVRRHSIQKQDIIACLERVLPVLLQRTGDSNARLRQRAQEAIIESANYHELKPLHVIPNYCVYPFNKTCAPRLALSRCELVEELMKILDVKKGENGLNVDNVSKFCAQALEHNAGEVRELSIKLLLSLYKTHGSIVKRYLPPDNDQTRRIKKYRDMFEAFDRIDGVIDKSVNYPSERSKRPNELNDGLKRDNGHKQQVQQHNSRDLNKSFDTKASHYKSRTPTRLDRKTPTTSVADESEFTPENTCIFCGEKNDEFARTGLETHYWGNCPMLRRCQECNQVVEIGIYIDHLLRECSKKGKYRQCPRCTEAIGGDFESHVKLKECVEAKPKTVRCPLCHMNIREGEKPWREHLMGVDGCTKNPRRIQTSKKIKNPSQQQQSQHQQQQQQQSKIQSQQQQTKSHSQQPQQQSKLHVPQPQPQQSQPQQTKVQPQQVQQQQQARAQPQQSQNQSKAQPQLTQNQSKAQPQQPQNQLKAQPQHQPKVQPQQPQHQSKVQPQQPPKQQSQPPMPILPPIQTQQKKSIVPPSSQVDVVKKAKKN